MVRGFGYKKDGYEKHPEAIANQFDQVYRIGGDEFVMIISVGFIKKRNTIRIHI